MRRPFPTAMFLLVLVGVLAVVLTISSEPSDAVDVIDTDWVVDEAINDTLQAKEYEMRANLTVTGNGRVTFRWTRFRFMCETPGEFGVMVLPGGQLTIDECQMSAGYLSPGEKGEAWTFYVQDSGRLALTKTNVSDLGVIGEEDRKEGLAIQSDNVGVSGCWFTMCNRGIVVMSSSSPSIWGNTFEDNQVGIEFTGSVGSLDRQNTFKNNGIGLMFLQTTTAFLGSCTLKDNDVSVRAVNSNLNIQGCTMDGTGLGVVAEVRSNVIARNCTVNTVNSRGKAGLSSTLTFIDCTTMGFSGHTMVDPTSNIYVRNSIQFKVAYKGAESPVEDAQIEVYDVTVNKVAQMVTGEDGLTAVVLLIKYEHLAGKAPKDYSPFKVAASQGYNYLELEGYDPGPNNLTVLRFVDDVQPELVVTAPTDGTSFNTRNVTFRGRVSDRHSGLAAMSLSVNGGAPRSLPLEPTWAAVVELPEGNLSIVITAKDLVGNEARVQLSVLVDVTPPTVTYIEPASGSVTRAYSLLVRGQTEEGSTLKVGSETIIVAPNGTFEGHITLGDVEGPHTLLFRLTDPVGNEGTYSYQLVVDRTPPSLTVETNPDYRDFSFTNVSTVLFFGTTEPGGRINISLGAGPALVATADDTGHWQTEVTLELGENYPVVDAFDAAGNRRTWEVITFYYDIEPPVITLLGPQNGTVTKQAEVVVEMRTEPDAIVWVNDLPEMVMPSHGELEFIVELTFEGDNPITVFARDPSGNLATVTLHVVREKPQKPNGDDSPGLGPVPVVVAILAVGAVLSVLVIRARKRR